MMIISKKLTDEEEENLVGCSKCGRPLIEEVHRLYFTRGSFHKNCYDFRLTAEERNNCGELLWKE